MKDKETHNNVFDILDKMEFFQGQRAGRELWNDKPKEVQDKDISDFIKDINYIRSYLQDSVVFSREEYKRITKELVTEQRATEIAKEYFEKIRKETAEKIYLQAKAIVDATKHIVQGREYIHIDALKEIIKNCGVEIKE